MQLLIPIQIRANVRSKKEYRVIPLYIWLPYKSSRSDTLLVTLFLKQRVYRKKSEKMKTTALVLMVLTVLSKILGFGRELALSYTYGASTISDAYIISLSIPSVIYGMLVAGIVAGYIPMYSKLKTQEGKLAADVFTNNVQSLLLFVSTIVLTFGLIFTEPIVKIFATGFDAQALQQTVQFTRLSFFAILFTGLVSVFSGYLQVNGQFVIPELLGFPLNISMILFIFISKGRSPYLLVVGYVVGVIAKLLFMIPALIKTRYTHKFHVNFASKNIRNLAMISIPIMLGTSVNQINVLIDRTLASQLEVGGISVLNYAETLNGFVQGIFVVSIVTVLYPMISQMVAAGNLQGVKKSISESLVSISLLVVPMTIGTMVFATQVVTVLFGYGAFDEKAILNTSSALFFYSVGMIAIGFQNVLVKVFYSMEETKVPVMISAFGVAINISLNFVLSKYLGIGGLALATSLAAIVVTTLLFIKLRKKIGAFGMRATTFTFLKIFFASLVMGGLARLAFVLFSNFMGMTVSFVLAVVVGAIVYIALISLLNIQEVTDLLATLKKRLNF